MRVPRAASALGLAVAAVTAALLLSSTDDAVQARQASTARGTSGIDAGVVTTGVATDLRPVAGVPAKCPQPVNVQPDVFPVQVGTVTAADGRKFPAPGPIQEGAIAPDIYNNCMGTGDNPNYASELKTVVVDEDGVEITGYIHADNYFELYVNGKFVARDSIPMTPFNSSVVRFKARYPMTYAIMGIDWETHLGLGMEYATWNIGDAGLIAYFSDGNGTHADWKAETFYVAPLDNPACVRVTATGRDSTFCHQGVRPTCAEKEPATCKALRFTIPTDWTSPRFNGDSRWPNAILWSAEAVTNQRAYTDYTKLFGDAEFIWTRNLRLDNLMLARYTAKGPRRK